MDSKNIFSKIKFEPTINLGHIISAGAFLFTLGMAWATIDGKIDKNYALATKEFTVLDIKNKEQDERIKDLGMELKQEIRSNTQEIKQELRDMRRR